MNGRHSTIVVYGTTRSTGMTKNRRHVATLVIYGDKYSIGTPKKSAVRIYIDGEYSVFHVIPH